MPRPRPSWRAPFIRYPKGAGPGAHAAFLAKRTAFNDFSPGSGRRQCVAIAKGSGDRCRNNAVQGAERCRTHKGIAPAIRNLKRDHGADKVRRLVHKHKAREALFAIGLKPAPEGLEVKANAVQGVKRGRLFEAYRNRAYAPGMFQEIFLQCQS